MYWNFLVWFLPVLNFKLMLFQVIREFGLQVHEIYHRMFANSYKPSGNTCCWYLENCARSLDLLASHFFDSVHRVIEEVVLFCPCYLMLNDPALAAATIIHVWQRQPFPHFTCGV